MAVNQILIAIFFVESRNSPAGLARRVTRVNRSPGAPPPSYVDSTYNSYFRTKERRKTSFGILFDEIAVSRIEKNNPAYKTLKHLYFIVFLSKLHSVLQLRWFTYPSNSALIIPNQLL